MNRWGDEKEIQKKLLDALRAVAPEVMVERLDFSVPLRDQLDLDSLDFFNFLVGIHRAFQIEIPEADYGQFKTIQSAVHYLLARQS